MGDVISLYLRRSRHHLLFLCLFAVGFALRTVAWLAYKPAILLLGDTLAYLNVAAGEASGPSWHPILYSLLLKPALWMGSLAPVTAIQHFLGLLLAVLLYLLLIRLGARPALAALGTAPLLLDAYQINLEQHILTEALFETLFVGALIPVGLVHSRIDLDVRGRRRPDRSLLGYTLCRTRVVTNCVGIHRDPPSRVGPSVFGLGLDEDSIRTRSLPGSSVATKVLSIHRVHF